jgi:hypothetical protein
MTGDPERLDAPNQQVVRPDGSGPAEEGKGAGKAPKPAPKATTSKKAGEAGDAAESPQESA